MYIILTITMINILLLIFVTQISNKVKEHNKKINEMYKVYEIYRAVEKDILGITLIPEEKIFKKTNNKETTDYYKQKYNRFNWN